MNNFIHPTCFIHPTASLGKNVYLGQGSFVGENVVIGDNNWFGCGVVLEKNVKIGNNNKIYHYAVIGSPPQHLSYKDEPTSVEIGDDNTIREFVTIHRGTTIGNGVTKIGSKNYFMAYTHIGHDCIVGSSVVITSFSGISGHTEIGDFVTIGGMSGTHQFVRIGEYAMIGGGSGVGRDVPPYTLAAGSVARLFGLNIIGLRRAGISSQDINHLKEIYKIVFRSGLLLKDSIAEAERRSYNSKYIKSFLNFIKESLSSKRGLLRETRQERAKFEE